jgi:hypothetical protein
MPTRATSGIEIVTGSPPVIPGAAAAPAGSVAALTAHRRVVLRHGAALTPALTQDDRRGTQTGRHLLPRPGEAVPSGTVAGVVADLGLGHPAGDALRPPVARSLPCRQRRPSGSSAGPPG